jgi:hypothetical protein
MASVRHRRADLDVNLEAWIEIQNDGVTVLNVSGSRLQTADVTSVKNGTGDYTITISPFKGPGARIFGLAMSETINIVANIVAFTYTGDSLAVQVKQNTDSTGAAADSKVMLHLMAE